PSRATAGSAQRRADGARRWPGDRGATARCAADDVGTSRTTDARGRTYQCLLPLAPQGGAGISRRVACGADRGHARRRDDRLSPARGGPLRGARRVVRRTAARGAHVPDPAHTPRTLGVHLTARPRPAEPRDARADAWDAVAPLTE